MFEDYCPYLYDIVSRIDAPLLDNSTTTFFNQLMFDTPLLRYFISRTGAFEAPHRAYVAFSDDRVTVTLLGRKGTAAHKVLQLGISCKASNWQLSSFPRSVARRFLPLSLCNALTSTTLDN